MDKNILIVASTSELAQRTIEELKKKDFNIYTTSRHAAEIPDKDIFNFHLDVSNEYDFIHLKEKLKDKKFDTIINFAGIAIAGAVVELDEAQLKKQFDVNYFGLLRIIKYLAPFLDEGGKLINVSSMASYGIFPFLSPYCASKAAADILLRAYSIENKVKVVSIRPGAIATKFWEASINLNKECLNKGGFREEKEFLVKNANKNSLHALNPILTAKKIAAIARKKNPKPVYNIGLDAKVAKLTRFISPKIVNSMVSFVLDRRIKKR